MAPIAMITEVNADLNGEQPQESLVIRQGRIDLSFHQVVGEIFAHVLSDPRLFFKTAKHPPKVNVEVFSAPHPKAFKALQEDQIDILIGWFDGSHGVYLQPIRDEVEVLGDARSQATDYTPPIYSPYCIWAVPSYVPEVIVPDVPSLADPSVAARFAKDELSGRHTLQGITPGAGISRFSEEMIRSYDLAVENWQFRPGTQAECFEKVTRCIEKKEWFVVPLWHPQYLHVDHHLRALKDPKGLLRPVDQARLVLSKKFLAKLSADQRTALLDVVGRVSLGNGAVALMDKYVHVDNLTYYDAAQRWIRDNQARVDSWFSSGHTDIVRRASEVDVYASSQQEENWHVGKADKRRLAIPDKAPAAAGSYCAYSISSNHLIHTSFQLTWELGHNLPTNAPPQLAFVGPLSTHSPTSANQSTISLQQACQAARICALNLLAQLRDAAGGDLARVQLLRLEGYVATCGSAEDTAAVPKILDAASHLLKHALGPKLGDHARTALIVNANPLDVPVMLGAVAELRW